MTAAAHRTGVGLLAPVRAVSWSCTCGTAETRSYGPGVDAAYAMRLMGARARRHRVLQALAPRLEKP